MTKYKLKKGFIIQKSGGKITIFDGEKSLLYTFNDSATFIFNHLKRGVTKKEIVGYLVTRYKIAKEQASVDSDELIADLRAKKIIE